MEKKETGGGGGGESFEWGGGGGGGGGCAVKLYILNETYKQLHTAVRACCPSAVRGRI